MDDERYKAARRRVVERLVLRLTFFFNLIFFLLLMALLWLHVPRSPDALMGSLFVFVLWGFGLLFHGALAFNLFGRFIDRQTRRELERAEAFEKPKRKRLELNEDGELVEVSDETSDEARYAER